MRHRVLSWLHILADRALLVTLRPLGWQNMPEYAHLKKGGEWLGYIDCAASCVGEVVRELGCHSPSSASLHSFG